MSSISLAPGQPGRVLMLGTFGLSPKGTMSARAAGIASELQQHGITVQIVTVPWDDPGSAGLSTSHDGVPVINTRFVHPRAWPLAVSEMIRVARGFKPDVIHLFKPKGFGDLAARALRRTGIPVVVDMDDWEGAGGWNDALPYGSVQRKLFDWQERTWPGVADGISVASRALEQYARELGASEDRLLYLPNQLSDHRFQILTDRKRPLSKEYRGLDDADRNRVLLYTRFVEFQPAFLVRTMSSLLARLPDASLIVAGGSADGSAERIMLNDAHRAGIAGQFQLLGWIDPDDLGGIARACSVALVPFDDTRINRAKCSIKLLELLATGIPVVASSIGENREYLLRHGAGSLARPGDAEDHADRLADRLRDDSIPDNALGSVSKTGLWKHRIHSVIDQYRRAISARFASTL